MSSHIARRTFATLMNKGGMPTRTLQEILGHSSIISTEKIPKSALR
ncbi:tyrosine-type recombinase/integrase [Spirosoma knui]